MLEYTKENLEKIYNETDEFFGYTYAYFLLAEFKEPKAFPYLIDLLNKDEEIVEYILGDDYPDYLPRLLAMDAVYERLENIYDKLGDKEKSKEYAKKWNEYVHIK